MSVELERPGAVRRGVTFYHEILAEMRKVTWPDVPQVRQLSLGVIALTLFIGGVIALMDLVLQGILVRGLPKLFGA